jgi:hypothetical protein
MKLLRCVFLLFLTASLLGAQDLPPVQTPVSPSSWRIDFAPAKTAKPGEAPPVSPVARLRRATYSLADGIVRVESAFDNNRSRITYVIGNEELSRDLQSGRIRWLRFSESSSGHLQASRAYPGFGWVEDRFLVGEETINGIKCLHYRFASENSADVFVREAWVSAKERNPVAFLEKGRIGTYTLLPAPAGPIEVPEDMLQYRRQRIRPQIGG